MADSIPLTEKIGRNGHLFEYAVLGLLAFRALHLSSTHKAAVWLVVGAVVLATAYGLSDEFHQSFIPGRDFDLRDLQLDLIGALVGAGIGSLWFRKPGADRPALTNETTPAK